MNQPVYLTLVKYVRGIFGLLGLNSLTTIFTAVLVFLAITVIQAQLHCINYTSQDGLPADHVTCGALDQDGFMWIGTVGGVCWYDGRRFVNYSNLGIGELPGAIVVNCITVDSKNDIWIGSQRQGIFRYQRDIHLWTRYHEDAPGSRQIPSNEIETLYAGKEGVMWYGGGPSGLSRIDIVQDTIIHYFLDSFPRRNRWPNAVYEIERSIQDENLLIFIGQGYIFQFDVKSKEIELLSNQDDPVGDMEPEFSPHSMVQSDDGKIWLGTWINGLWQYNLNQNELKKIHPHPPSDDNQWRVGVIKGVGNEIWAMPRKVGLYNYNNSDDKWELYQAEPYNRNGLMAAEYSGGLVSDNGDVWIFSTKGISLLVPEYQSFRYHDDEVSKLNFFLDSYFDSITAQYHMAYGGEHGAFKIFDRDFNLLRSLNFRHDGSFQAIYKIRNVDDQNYFISSDLLQLDRKRKGLITAGFSGIETEGRYVDLIKDQFGKYWLLVNDNSVIRYDPITLHSDTYIITDHSNDQNNLYSNYDIAEIGDYIWIAAGSELVVWSNQPEPLSQRYHFYNEELIEVSNASDVKHKGYIEKIIPDGDNCAWILMHVEGLIKVCHGAASHGLSLTERRDKKDLPQLQSPIDMVRGLNNDYWIATHNGLVHADDSLTSFRVFNQSHGLRSSKLEQGLSIANEKLLVGMPKGFVEVDMHKLMNQRSEIDCHIIMAKIDTILLDDSSQRKFHYKQNDFSVEVAVPNFHDAQTVSYAHRLSGVNDDWVYTSSGQYSFQYDNLTAGAYTFEVKARSESIPWSDVTSLDFRIEAPFWERLWFRILAMLTGIAIVYLIYRLRLRRELEKEKINTEFARLENIALRSQMNPHFIFNSLNSIKSLMLLDRKGESIKYLTHFSKMVREVLSISQETSISLERELALLALYIEMEQLRFKDRFTYHLEVDPSVQITELFIPPLLIQPYVENAIWHGLMHKDGEAVLKINLTIQGGQVNIIIEDNGIGRAASRLLSEQSMSHRKKRLGMQINERRVALMNNSSSIVIEDLYHVDRSAAGTRVIIQLQS